MQTDGETACQRFQSGVNSLSDEKQNKGEIILKLLHTSDWHLGRALSNNQTYIQDQRFFFDRLYSIIREEKIDAVLVAGDVYDSGISNAEAINLYNEVVTEICLRAGVPMIIIAGNHDSGPRLASCRDLLKGAGLCLSGRLSADLSPVVFGNTAIYSLPYFSKDEAAAIFPEKKDEITSAATAMKAVCDIIRAGMDKTKKNILVSHSLVQNVELSDSDHSAQIGTASAVSRDVFDGFDYVALGHIHKPQSVSDKIRYSGSPVKYSFGKEENQEKGVVIIDTEDMSQKFVQVGELHGRRTVKGTYEEIISMKNLENCYLSIVVTDRTNAASLYNEMKERFPFMLELKGREYTISGAGTTVSALDIEKLDDTAILKSFMKDIAGMEPDEEQLELFREAVEASDREVEEN